MEEVLVSGNSSHFANFVICVSDAFNSMGPRISTFMGLFALNVLRWHALAVMANATVATPKKKECVKVVVTVIET